MMTAEQYEFRRPCTVALGHTSTTGRMVALYTATVLIKTVRGQYLRAPYADVTPN